MEAFIYLAIFVLIVAGFWKVFEKAGQPGWAALIPIYNLVVYLQVAGKPIWWILLYFIPLVNLIVSVIVSLSVAERFGKSAAYAMGLLFLPFIFIPMLGFSDAKYQGA